MRINRQKEGTLQVHFPDFSSTILLWLMFQSLIRPVYYFVSFSKSVLRLERRLYNFVFSFRRLNVRGRASPLWTKDAFPCLTEISQRKTITKTSPPSFHGTLFQKTEVRWQQNRSKSIRASSPEKVGSFTIIFVIETAKKNGWLLIIMSRSYLANFAQIKSLIYKFS